VFGLSLDSAKKQQEFVTAHKLIADSKGDVAKALGIPLKFGGKFAARQAFLFKDGKLVWRDEKGATSSQGEDALKVISEQ